MGYDGLFLGRIDYQDKQKRLKEQTAEMIWHASDNLGQNADLFTGALYNTYSPPPGFCFDILCTDEPIIDNKRSTEYNVVRRVSPKFPHFLFFFQMKKIREEKNRTVLVNACLLSHFYIYLHI